MICLPLQSHAINMQAAAAATCDCSRSSLLICASNASGGLTFSTSLGLKTFRINQHETFSKLVYAN